MPYQHTSSRHREKTVATLPHAVPRWHRLPKTGHMAAGRFTSSRFIPVFALLAALSIVACTSHDERAATAAAIAADAFGQGNLPVARAQIGRALAARDDVSDYWMLSGRIAMAEGNYASAFEAFESALTLDRSNVEALTRLCQIAVSGNQPERAERYAGELAALQPGNKIAVNVQAAIALDQGDKPGAAKLLDQVLAADPHDATGLMTKSRLFAANEDYLGAARLAEASLTTPGDPVGRLVVLKDLYAKGRDVAGWRRTVARLARAQPANVPSQIDYARSLYNAGDTAGGFAISRRVLALRPNEVATADRILHLWLEQGKAAMAAADIAVGAANAPPETRAAFAAYANAIGRPELALQVLGNENSGNAAVARAQGLALLGRRDAAAAAVASVLAADPDQPRALALRASLRPGDRPGAVEDLRHALSGDPAAADARLALADLQLAGGDGVLAAATLRDGLDEPDPDPRLAIRLAALLRGEGRASDASAVLVDFAQDHPFARQPQD